MDRSWLAQSVLLVQTATHKCFSCSSLLSLLHFSIHEWMAPGAPSCKVVQNNKQGLFRWAHPGRAKASSRARTKLQAWPVVSTLHEAPAAAVHEDRRVQVLTSGHPREPGRTHLLQFPRIYLEEVSVSQNLRNSVANMNSKALTFTLVKERSWGKVKALKSYAKSKRCWILSVNALLRPQTLLNLSQNCIEFRTSGRVQLNFAWFLNFGRAVGVLIISCQIIILLR